MGNLFFDSLYFVLVFSDDTNFNLLPSFLLLFFPKLFFNFGEVDFYFF